MRKYWPYILLGVSFVLYYFISRFINLTDLPIFTDEAIYIRWAQIGSQDPELRFYSLTDGKQPLFIWAVMIAVRIFSDPLFAGRVVSIISGFVSLIGIGVLSYELFRKKTIAIFASILYATSPFTLMYDRLALMDNMVSMFAIWSLYLSIKLVKTIRLDMALLLSMALGGGILTKTNGFLSIYMLPLTLLLFNWKDKKWRINLLRLIGLMFIAVIFSQLYYSILRLSPWFNMISQKDSAFVELPASYSIPVVYEWFDYRTRFFVGNIKALFEWITIYLTLPVTFLGVGALLLPRREWNKKLLLIIWSLAPLAALAFTAKVLYPRFVFSMAMPILVLAAWGLDYLIKTVKIKRVNSLVLVIIILIYPVYVQSKILFSVLTAPIPMADVNQYISDEYSGWGIREVNAQLSILSENQEIIVYTDGTFGLLPFGIEIYLVDHPNIEIKGIWPTPEEYTDEIKTDIASFPTYFVANQRQELPEKWNGELMGIWQKGLRDDRHLRLFFLKSADWED